MIEPKRRTACWFGAAGLAGAILWSLVSGFAIARADERRSVAAFAVTVTKAGTECFSSVVRATGYIVPRATAVVMFNAPNFKITAVSAVEGDWVKAGDQVAVASGLGGAPAAPGNSGAKGPGAEVPIKSPVDGRVLARNAEPGMLAAPTNGPLFTLAIDGETEALVDVPSIHVLELSTGQTVHLTFDDGREFSGHVRVVPVEIDKVTQVGQARLSIDSEKPLGVGRFVHVTIDARRSCGIGVPLAALTHESDGIRLQVVKNGIIESRMVSLGLLGDADAEIVKGVQEGDLVVSDAGTSLRDGDKVSPSIANALDNP